MRRSKIFITLGVLTLLAACGGDPTSGAVNSGDDVGMDVGVDVENGDGEDAGSRFSPPQFYQVASGGGAVQGGGYKAVIGIGATTLRGDAKGGSYEVRFGPVSP